MIYTKKEDEKNKLRMGGGSWTINLDRIDITKYDEIHYFTKKKKYIINKYDALDNGFIRTLGGETKLVVPLEFWEVK